MKIIVYCDGFFGKRTDPMPGCSYAVVIRGEVVEKHMVYAEDFIATSNQAEYFALYTALTQVRRLLKKHPKAEIIVYSDSMLVVNQYNRRWQCTGRLLAWRKKCYVVCPPAENVQVLWISRVANVKILGH
jgi:ribonuclease HI